MCTIHEDFELSGKWLQIAIFVCEMLVTDIKNARVWQGHVDFYAGGGGQQDTLEVCAAITHFYSAVSNADTV